jgi:hypothetical protein
MDDEMNRRLRCQPQLVHTPDELPVVADTAGPQ